ncbi:MAG TPA: hypothetical protein VFR91_00735 [Dyella sp.]|nr:hypothetical protein [Dyella sp.]
MDGSKLDAQRDFVARQYAHLVTRGLDDASARQRLREVLGAAAVEWLGTEPADSAATQPEDADGGRRVVGIARQLGGDAGRAQAELIQAFAQARLLALDWWRPVRSFLLYALFLLALAAVIAAVYLLFVLPAFSQLDRTIGVGDGAAGWISAHGAIRLLAPLVVMAVAFALLAMRWVRAYRRMARFEPLAGVDAFQVLRCLEFAAAIHASGVADAAVLAPALEAAGWPAGRPLEAAGEAVGERLDQAGRLGSFAAELDWQRRVHWSTTQARLELSRDRLILFARVLFYILIGSMVTVLYLPIFSVASMMGVQ